MNVVAVMALARSVEEEAPHLASALGITTYEAALLLRAPPPVIVLRSDDRARTGDLASKLRSRGHDVVACELESVVGSEAMFAPKSFRFEAGDFIGIGSGEERSIPSSAILALVRATHATRIEDTVTTRERKLSLGRAMLTGGLLMTNVALKESKRVTDEREPVLYVFAIGSAPWLLLASQMRYDGLGQEMRRSQVENFEVLVKNLRDLAPAAPFDARLLANRASPSTVVNVGPKHLSVSSSHNMDVLAHLIAVSLSRTARPYR